MEPRREEPDPERQLSAYATALADGIERALPGWVRRSVARVMTADAGYVPEEVVAAASHAGAAAQAEITPALRRLLTSDIDEQTTTPLALVRRAVRYPTEVLEQAGAAPVRRDEFSMRAFPGDVYGLTPATLTDLDPELAEPALAWGAAKAFVHKRRHG